LQQDCLSVEGLPPVNSVKRHVLRAAAMQARISHERNIRLSVCPSAKRVNCDKTKETSAKILTAQENKQSFQFCDKENGWWGRPFYLKFWAK